jgi:hypothetical protein
MNSDTIEQDLITEAEITPTAIASNSFPRQLDRDFVMDCVVNSVAIYYNVNKKWIVDLKKRGQFSELRGICYFLLHRRHSPNFTYEVMSQYFHTYPSKICILRQKVEDRIKAKLYQLDHHVGVIECNINAVIKQYEANLQNKNENENKGEC